MILELGKTLAAEFAETARVVNAKLPPLTETELQIHQTLARTGIAIIPRFFDQTKVWELRQEVDRLIASSKKLWVDKCGSDKRYFGADNASIAIREYLEHPFIQKMGKRYARSELKGHLSLAAKMTYREGNLGSGGGWHRDSPISRQFKSLLYLSDVDEKNGPFEYLVGTHQKKSVLNLVSKRLQRYRQYRFTDEEVAAILKQTKIQKQQIVGRGGDLVLVDTKGIHRGAPMTGGERYAITNYFWRDRIPEHITSQMNLQ